MPEWSFQRKLITGVIGICLLAVLTSAAALVASQVLVANMATITAGEGRDLSDAKALQLLGVRSIKDVRGCLLAGGAEFTLAARASSEALHARVETMRAHFSDPEASALLDSVGVAEATNRDTFEHALLLAGSYHLPSAVLYPPPVRARGDHLEQTLAALVGRVEDISPKSLANSRSDAARYGMFLNGITILTILLLVVLCVILISVLERSYGKQSLALGVAEQGQSQAETSLSEAEAAGHLKDEFLATVSHELRNPLAPILTWTQLLRSGTLDEDKSRRALEVIERNVLSQAQLIDDLVDVSRVASGKFRLDVRPIELTPVIRAAAEALGPASEAKKIRMQLVLDERTGPISGDSERIQQVMSNLISNAIKFTPKGGRVQIVLQRSESHVKITVSDSGIGIEPGFLPHVFEAFQQGSGGSMRRHGGLGLGLSIVRHIVELHGGEITAQSEGANLGSKFTVKFPLLATADVTEPSRRHPIARDALADVRLASLAGIRVLIVEDEPSAIEALLVLFQSCGAEAKGAGSASEALLVLDTWLPDVVVSDIAMPGEDGYSLIRRIRLRSPDKGGLIPAVALTAYAKIEDRVTILAAGFQMYLSKPADPNELAAVVSSLARRRGLEVSGIV